MSGNDFPGNTSNRLRQLEQHVQELRREMASLISQHKQRGKNQPVSPVMLGKAKEVIGRGSTGTVGWWYGFADPEDDTPEEDSEIEHQVKNLSGVIPEEGWVLYTKIQDTYYSLNNIPGRYFALNPSGGAEVSGDVIYPHFAPIVGEHDYGLKITRNLSHPSASGKSVFVFEEESNLYKFHWDLSFFSDPATLSFNVWGTVGTLAGSYKQLACVEHQGGAGHVAFDYWAAGAEIDAYLYLEIASSVSPVNMDGGITSIFEAERIL